MRFHSSVCGFILESVRSYMWNGRSKDFESKKKDLIRVGYTGDRLNGKEK